jgi:hypothetical protein
MNRGIRQASVSTGNLQRSTGSILVRGLKKRRETAQARIERLLWRCAEWAQVHLD